MKTKLTKKKGGIFSRNINSVAAAVIAAVIMVFAYAVWEFFPFGEKIILRMDLYHQYAPLLAELYERIFGGDSLLYSFTSGLGSSFLGNYFNYLSSPVTLLIMVFGHYNIPEAVAAIVLVKAAAAAYTFTYFLGKVTKKSDLTTTAFGLLYAFSGYFIAYYWNIMWLDAVVVLPLVMLGIWYIIEDGRSLPYVLSLAYVMMTNYYMAYMTCILSVIFFLYFYFSKNTLSATINRDIILKGKYKKSGTVKLLNSKFVVRGVNFAASSILAALIAGFALLPVYFILQNSSATSSTFPSSFTSYFSIFDYFANHLAGVEPTIRSSGDTVYPNVYCGIITLILVPLFMFSERFTHREKIATATVSAVFFLSFNINYLNFIWHGFHFPNDLPYRFSFAYSFFILYIAYRVLTQIDKIPSKAILVSASCVAGFTVLVEKIGSANVDLTVVWTSIIFAIVYAVVLVFIKNPKYLKSAIALLLLTSVCAEILIADTPNYTVTQSKTSYTSSYDDTTAAIEMIEEKEGEDSFYRMELVTLLTRMDNSWFYYPGVSTFTSMAYEYVAKLQDYLGLYGNKINSYTYNMQTGLYNSMMSIKYIADNSSYVATDNYSPDFDGDFLYSKVGEYEDITIYENRYWLPVAFAVDGDTDTDWDYTNENPFAVQNDFYYQASGVADILEPIVGKVDTLSNIDAVSDSNVESGTFSVYKTDTSAASNEISFAYEVTETQNVYVYFESSNIDSILVTTGNFTYNQSIGTKHYVLNVGNVEAGTTLYISYSLDDDATSTNVNQYVYGLNENKFINAYNEIQSNGVLDVTVNDESYIKGTIDLANGSMLYTSIPYDKGWAVYVDGIEVSDENIVKVGDALMGVKMDAGEHTVEFKYTPRGLIVGLSMTFAGFAILIILLILKKKKKLMFSDRFKADVLALGMWRDKALEAEAEAEKEAERAQLEQMLEDAQADELINAESDELWIEALNEAESYVKKKLINGDISDLEKTLIENDIKNAENSDFDDFETLDDKSIDDVIAEFEKATDDIENIKTMSSTDDNKSSKNKKLGIVVGAVIVCAAIAVGVAVMFFASGDDNTKTPDNDVVADESQSSLAPAIVSEEDSSEEEIATIETTASETTTQAPVETTTEQTTVATTTPATIPTTAATTKVAATTEAYTGELVNYTVQSGDTFYSILRSFGVKDSTANVQVLCAVNGFSISTTVRVGQVIKVPVDL